MDAALFAPYRSENVSFKWSFFEWSSMVHGVPVNIVMERLENLKRESVLENLGDGLGRIGMHDLWREFARLETKVGKFEDRRWIFEWDEYNVLGEAILTTGGGLVYLRRMFFLDKGFMKLKDVDFACFPNLAVLKLCTNFACVEVLDLSGLKHLKSLELESGLFPASAKQLISVFGLGSLSKLVFLRWLNIPSVSPRIDEIGSLTNLLVLDLRGCVRLPNLSKLISLQVACFRDNESVATILGLSSKHTNLQFLDLSWCEALQSCWGVGELVALQELRLNSCSKLKEVPDLQKLKQLRKLVVNGCQLLRALPGLGDLVSLLELHAFECYSLEELPDMHNLMNLRILDLRSCHLIESLPGLDELVCLQSLETTGCENLTQLPNLYKLTNLQTLRLDTKASLQSFAGWSDLILLRSLQVGIHELHGGLDLCNLTKLKSVHISGWQGRGFSSLEELVSLELVFVHNCKGVPVLPDLKRLSRLRNLGFQRCDFEDLSGLCILTSLEELDIRDCNKLEALPDLRELARLEEVRVEGCALLRDLRGILGLRNLKSLLVRGNPWLHEILGPDLHQLTGLRDLCVSDCVDLQWLATCSQLHFLDCSGCPIQELPDLANFPKLSSLYVRDCVNLMNLTCSVPLCPNFKNLDISGCKRLQTLPDFTNARQMEWLNVTNSGVVVGPEFIHDIQVRWPAIRLVVHETSSRVQRQGSSRGIWGRTIRMITSLHCGCTGTSLAVRHPS